MKHSNISIFIPHNGCPCKCSFCNQSKITGQNTQPSFKEVEETLSSAALYINDKEKLKNTEIAFFGGSFTAIDYDYMVGLLKIAKEAVIKFGFKGIRCSTRPDKIDKAVLTVLKEYGVTAIELGAQSMCDEVLLNNNRGHSSESVRIASRLIKEFGFELGLQMMTDLYTSSKEKDIYTAKELIKLKPDTVRIYPTVTLENTELADLYKENKYKPCSLEDTVELCSKLLTMFEKENIKVIRLGLHASEEVSSKRIAGAYHPALREKCESYNIYINCLQLLKDKAKGDYVFEVNPKLISKFIGQKKENILKLKKEGFNIKVTETNSVHAYKLIERIGE